jgi:hypothetical protein
MPSVFAPSNARERAANVDDYWRYSLGHGGEILEAEQNLTEKKAILDRYRAQPVRSRKPLCDPQQFYRNYVVMNDDPSTLDRKTLLLTFLYKFARHEWVGISAAWDGIPDMAHSVRTTDKISRYHLCEEFCHVRLFHEMFRTLHLQEVQWVPLGKWMGRAYRFFARLPEWLMSPLAFVSELMGLTLYLHTDAVLEQVFADEPEARDRIRALLREITIDELAHVGQRRNFLGPVGIRISRWMLAPMSRLFFRDIPETKFLFDVNRMIRDGQTFDYSGVPDDLLARSWVPSYCRQAAPHGAAQPA